MSDPKPLEYFLLRNNQYHEYYMVPEGWGRGYVKIPSSHPLYGKDYNTINEILNWHEEEITHGGFLTIDKEDVYCFGFDTSHWRTKDWTREDVERTAISLAAALFIYWIVEERKRRNGKEDIDRGEEQYKDSKEQS